MSIEKRELRFIVEDEGILNYGQRVYRVESSNHKEYTEKCPICDDEKKITIKGMQFDCPLCRGYKPDINATRLAIYNYVPIEYIINKVEIEGEEVRAAYNKDGSPADFRFPRAVYSGFARTGTSQSSIRTKRFSRFDFQPHDPDSPLLGRSLDGEFCFLKKTDAEAFIRRIHQRQSEMLRKFNEKHGTDHKYPFAY